MGYRTNLVLFTDFLRQSPKQRSRRYMDKELLAVSNLQ